MAVIEDKDMNTLMQKSEKGKNLLPWLIFILIFALYLPAMFLMDIPSRDVALRYAPAADAFAQGDWLNAFHPRFQMLHQLFSGIFTFLFRTDGFTGTKLSSLFFYALGVFPFFALMREVFTEKIAKFSLLFYLFASRILILGYEGLRESHKMLVILLLALGMIHIVKQSERLKGYMITGIAAGLAVCTRNDMILFSVCILVFCGILDSYRNSISWRSLVMFLFAGISAMPEFLVNYWITGYFIPGA
jgi:4-amino-4-deoxy-L-arabinose transferase-like glycosyltransferase